MNAKDLLDRKSFCTLLDCLVKHPNAEELQAVLNYYEGVRVQGNMFHPDMGKGLEAVIPIKAMSATDSKISFSLKKAADQLKQNQSFDTKPRRGRKPGSKNKVKVTLSAKELAELAASDDGAEIAGRHIVKQVDKDQGDKLTPDQIIKAVIAKHVKGKGGKQFAIPERFGEYTVAMSNKKWEEGLKSAGVGFNALDWAYIEELWRGPSAGPGTGYMALTLS